MASTSSGVRYGASRRAGGWAKVQYPHLSRQSIVSGMKTLGEYVIRFPWAESRTARAWAISSSRGTSKATDMRAPYCPLRCAPPP